MIDERDGASADEEGATVGYYSVWPSFACLALLLLAASTPAFRAADAPPNARPNRNLAIDGLRGFLALAVVMHHASVYVVYARSGVWDLPPSRFYTHLGALGVSLFFMITGYLFWDRVLSERGRPAWARLYIGRLFRIGPLYLCAVATMLLIVFQASGFHLAISARLLAGQLARWSCFGLGGTPDVNGYYQTSMILAGVTWTLRYEWLFYLGLLPLSLLARWRYNLEIAAAALIALIAWSGLKHVAASYPATSVWM